MGALAGGGGGGGVVFTALAAAPEPLPDERRGAMSDLGVREMGARVGAAAAGRLGAPRAPLLQITNISSKHTRKQVSLLGNSAGAGTQVAKAGVVSQFPVGGGVNILRKQKRCTAALPGLRGSARQGVDSSQPPAITAVALSPKSRTLAPWDTAQEPW